MWLVMMCAMFCDVDVERNAGWNFEAAYARRYDYDTSLPADYHHWDTKLHSATSTQIETLTGVSFPTRAACMAAVKRAVPRGLRRAGGVRFETEFFADYVQEHLVVDFRHSYYEANYACFKRAPTQRVS